MKLVRYGKAGKEKPGVIDKHGKLRDASELVADWDGAHLHPKHIKKLAKALKAENCHQYAASRGLAPASRSRATSSWSG